MVISAENTTKNNDINIVYTGTLNERYGVVNLVKAFMKINDDRFRLVICGLGDSEKIISEASLVDKRIIFKGQLRKDEIIKVQNSATILVNPRQNIEEFTKYSFPSKIMEYLATGKPVVAYKLDGMPDEYDNYIIYVPENSIEALTKTIYNVCTQPYEKLITFGASAKHWVVTEKNGITQTKKIIDMIRSINTNK
jgi:glycosyltransferase involved in cell wall biosynthesis